MFFVRELLNKYCIGTVEIIAVDNDDWRCVELGKIKCACWWNYV